MQSGTAISGQAGPLEQSVRKLGWIAFAVGWPLVGAAVSVLLVRVLGASSLMVLVAVLLFVAGIFTVVAADRARLEAPVIGRTFSGLVLVFTMIWGTICMGAGLQEPMMYAISGVYEVPLTDVPTLAPAWLRVTDGRIDLSRARRIEWTESLPRMKGSPQKYDRRHRVLAPVVTEGSREPVRVWACAEEEDALRHALPRGPAGPWRNEMGTAAREALGSIAADNALCIKVDGMSRAAFAAQAQWMLALYLGLPALLLSFIALGIRLGNWWITRPPSALTAGDD